MANIGTISPSWQMDEAIGYEEIDHVNEVLRRHGLRTVRVPCQLVDVFPLPMPMNTFLQVATELVGEWELDSGRWA